MATTKTVVRWGAYLLGLLVALALMAAGTLFYLVSRLDVKAEVQRALKTASGREVTIEGPVGVSFWPVLGLKAKDIRVANVQAGRAPYFDVMDEVDIGVELRPLLNRQVVVRQLVLVHP